MTFDDIRRLNIREAGNWPLLPKAAFLLAILLAIVAAGAVLDWKDQYETLDRAQQEESKLKEQYATKKAKAINYDIYVQQLKEIEQSFGALLKQLPNKAEMDALLTDINQAGLGRGLQFELFKPAAQERLADFYAELPIAVKITGNYHDMGAFASDVAQLPRIVTLNDLVVANDKGVLTMDAVAKTFRYLDDEEIAGDRVGGAGGLRGGRREVAEVPPGGTDEAGRAEAEAPAEDIDGRVAAGDPSRTVGRMTLAEGTDVEADADAGTIRMLEPAVL